MRQSRPSALGGAVAAFVAAATTWVAMLAWRGFTEEPGRYLVPLALLGAIVAGLGALLRWWRAPAPAIVLTQIVVAGLVAAAIISGSALPIGDGWTALVQAFTDARTTANTFAPPVPSQPPGVHPFLIAGGLGSLLLVDVIACTLRRAPLAGLPLLTVYSVPVGVLGVDLAWWVFATSAVGFLLLLFLEQGERVRRWGRTLDSGEGSARNARRTSGRVGTPRGMRVRAGAIGGGVTGLAVLLPLIIPTLSVQLLDIGRGPGGDGDIEVVNPTTDLRRDLQRSRDVPLLRVATDDPRPSYLRIATLNRFSGTEWSSGNREIPAGQTASGPLPPLTGVRPTLTRTTYSYRLRASDSFESTWLPTPENTTSIQADGDWRYDTATLDFIASGDDLTTAGVSWSLEAASLALDANTMAQAPSSVGQVDEQFLELPNDIAPYVRNLSLEVTRDASSRYEKAVALQNWFRESGGFTYDTSVDLGTGTDDLVRFLSPTNGGRVGYCEQFASSMAVMARQLGIPARVAVGFLIPDKVGDDTYEYSSHDLHAWPELFISGSGWVRFEPTPAARASAVPAYTAQGITPVDPDVPAATDGANPDEELPRDNATNVPAVPEATPEDAASTDESSTNWLPVLVGVLAAGVLAGLLLTPRLVRRRRRDRRRDGDVEAAWVELRDTTVDLRLAWPDRRSPRETGAALSTRLSDERARAALDRIVSRLERRRYAPVGSPVPTDDAAGLRRDVELVVEGLQVAVTPGARRRALWLPRSVFRRGSGKDTATQVPVGDDTGSDHLLERV